MCTQNSISLIHILERLFEVKFEGEEGLDWGGLYREGLYCCVEDLFSGRDINLFILCPNGNNEAQLVANTDKFLPNPRHSSPLAMQMFEFVGKLMGISIRTKALLPFEFAPLVWKLLAGEKLTQEDLESVDLQLTERLRKIAAGVDGDPDNLVAAGAPVPSATSASETFSAEFPDLHFVVPGRCRRLVFTCFFNPGISLMMLLMCLFHKTNIAPMWTRPICLQRRACS